MSFTTTTNLSLKLPEIGGATDQWGQYLLDNFISLDSTINTVQTSLLQKADTSALGTYVSVDTTGLTNYTKTTDIQLATASDVQATGTYADNDFLVYSGSTWTNKTKTAAQISLLPAYGSAGTVLRIATSGGLEWATLGFQRAYTVGTSDPAGASSADGDLFFNTASNTLKIYNSAWVSVIQTDATTPTTGDVIALSIALG